MTTFWKTISVAGLACWATVVGAASADAFCGFYVSGADDALFNNATQVVLMRMGTTTVLSMQNDYQGPPEDFAMVVPVPVVLKETNVKTLPKEIFSRVNTLAAPRLVEYWEKDPCEPDVMYDMMVMESGAVPTADGALGGVRDKVKIEAQFKVGEYDVVVLSATESTALDTWLRQEKYNIPRGAEPYLKPYVASGAKFFVAKVDSKKVKFKDGRVELSPLRFHFDSMEFSLPIRLGMINSAGMQDLLVHILSPGQRYEAANYKNVTIPTNLEVSDDTRAYFGEFYAALFDRTLAENPRSVVTEYAWDAATCDPCPLPPLSGEDLATLGADVVGAQSFVLTRLHARYSKDGIDEDLVFRAAPPLFGGREVRGSDGALEVGASPGQYNNFQGRYAMRHPWTGDIKCEKPVRGRWGGPPAGVRSDGGTASATNSAFAPRGQRALASFVSAPIPEIAFDPEKEKTPLAQNDIGKDKTARKGCTGAFGGTWMGLAFVLGALAIRKRRACGAPR